MSIEYEKIDFVKIIPENGPSPRLSFYKDD